MKAIKNQGQLLDILFAEDKNWQKLVFEQTGVIAFFSKNNSILFSNCGYIDLDYNSEYHYVNGKDCTDYCVISSIQDFVEYIRSMAGYKDFLVDVSYGQFLKSELFWAVYACIISPEENQKRVDGSHHQDWRLNSISSHNSLVEFYMDLVDYDNCIIRIEISNHNKLSEVLFTLSQKMNECSKDIQQIPRYRVYENAFNVPKTYRELEVNLLDNGLFA